MKYVCEHCHEEIDVTVRPGLPGQYYGPPESCYPEEEASIDPERCCGCKRKLDINRVLKKYEQMMSDWFERDDIDDDKWARA